MASCLASVYIHLRIVFYLDGYPHECIVLCCVVLCCVVLCCIVSFRDLEESIFKSWSCALDVDQKRNTTRKCNIHGAIHIVQYKWCNIYRAIYIYIHVHMCTPIGRLLKIISLFCNRALQKRRYSAKETCSFKAPTHRSQRIRHVTYAYVIHTHDP